MYSPVWWAKKALFSIHTRTRGIATPTWYRLQFRRMHYNIADNPHKNYVGVLSVFFFVWVKIQIFYPQNLTWQGKFLLLDPGYFVRTSFICTKKVRRMCGYTLSAVAPTSIEDGGRNKMVFFHRFFFLHYYCTNSTSPIACTRRYT